MDLRPINQMLQLVQRRHICLAIISMAYSVRGIGEMLEAVQSGGRNRRGRTVMTQKGHRSAQQSPTAVRSVEHPNLVEYLAPVTRRGAELPPTMGLCHSGRSRCIFLNYQLIPSRK